MTETLRSQLAVVGAGPGGYAAAFMAADLGLDVTLIDTEPNPGGVCLYRGCIPSKTLLHVAEVISEAREAKHWGVQFTEPKIDLATLRRSKDAVVTKMTGGLGQLCKMRSVPYIQGRASFLDSTTLKIVKGDGSEVDLNVEHTILATGSRPSVLPTINIESSDLLNSTTALEIESIPKTLLVVGGGYIGLELGSVYATLGTKVTVVEMTGSLLPGADADLVRILAARMELLMHRILLNTKVTDIKTVKGGLQVTMEGPKIDKPDHTFEKVLVAIGRKPNSSGLGLSNTKVTIDPRGFVQVNSSCHTSDPNILAIGDVAGEPMLAHKATHEGRIAAQIVAGQRVEFSPNAIPAVVFTNPEVAWCGLTENEASKRGMKVDVSRFPWAASGRATTLNQNDGLTKILTDPETHRVVGVGIVGPRAGELIAEGVLAVEMGALANDIGHSIHPHPTLSETIMETADSLFGHSTHIYRPKREHGTA
jgi:dihydrolipoamide dehydrogenase